MGSLPRLAVLARPDEFEVRTERTADGRAVVHVRGELDMATSSQLEEALEATSTREPVVVDLSECVFLDSTAVRVLLTAASKQESAGGELTLVAPDARIRRVLEIAGVDTKFPVRASLDESG